MTKIVLLMLALIAGDGHGDNPNLRKVIQVDDMEICVAKLQEFMATDLTDEMKAHGIIGKHADCGFLYQQDAPRSQGEKP